MAEPHFQTPGPFHSATTEHQTHTYRTSMPVWVGRIASARMFTDERSNQNLKRGSDSPKVTWLKLWQNQLPNEVFRPLVRGFSLTSTSSLSTYSSSDTRRGHAPQFTCILHCRFKACYSKAQGPVRGGEAKEGNTQEGRGSPNPVALHYDMNNQYPE